jgi:hypothetical protein
MLDGRSVSLSLRILISLSPGEVFRLEKAVEGGRLTGWPRALYLSLVSPRKRNDTHSLFLISASRTNKRPPSATFFRRATPLIMAGLASVDGEPTDLSRKRYTSCHIGAILPCKNGTSPMADERPSSTCSSRLWPRPVCACHRRALYAVAPPAFRPITQLCSVVRSTTTASGVAEVMYSFRRAQSARDVWLGLCCVHQQLPCHKLVQQKEQRDLS